MMVKSSILLKTAKFILTVFFGAIIFGQEGEIIPLSQKVGLTLDAEENLFYNVYSDIDGFESAQFYEVSIKTVIARITYVQYAQQKTSKRKYTMMEFLRMKEAVDVQPFITAEDRRMVKENLTYLQTDEILDGIQEDQYVTIHHRSGRRIRGTLKKYSDKMLAIQTPVSLEKIPIWDMESISYRESIKNRSSWEYPLYAFSALAGLALAEGWNEQTRPYIDSIWHYRFLGAMSGLLAGSEAFQTFNVLTSPKIIFALTPEEMDSLKE